MKFKVSSSDEVDFYPSIIVEGEELNLNLAKEEQFKIVLHRLNATLHYKEWTGFDKNGRAFTIWDKKLRKYIARLEKEPEMDNGSGTVHKLVIKDLVTDSYPEIIQITNQIVKWIDDFDSGLAPEDEKK